MESAALAVVAAALLLYGLRSHALENSPFTAPLVLTGLGALLAWSGLLHLGPETPGVRLLAEVALAVVLFGDAARIDLGLLRREHDVALRLLASMPLVLLAGTVAGRWLLGLDWGAAALLAAFLTPTDAALGQAVLRSPQVPERIRQSLNVESGLNDGIALPAVLLLIALTVGEGGAGGAAGWIRFVALQLLLGPLVGVAIGWLGGRAFERAQRSGRIAPAFERIASVALALLAFGAAESVGGNGFIAAFSAGLTVGAVARSACGPLLDFAEAEGQLLTLTVFVVFGAGLAAPALAAVAPGQLLYALASLTLVRMLPVALLLVGTGLRPASLLFLGWFGPRGIASVLFLLLALEEGEVGAGVAAAVAVTVSASIALHGLSAAPGARLYARLLERGRSHDEMEAMAEMREITPMPLRIGGMREPAADRGDD